MKVSISKSFKNLVKVKDSNKNVENYEVRDLKILDDA